jgi:hypothetical protein
MKKYLSKTFVVCFYLAIFCVFSDDMFKPEDALILKEFKTNKMKRNTLAPRVIKILSGDNLISIAGNLKKEITKKKIIEILGKPDSELKGNSKHFYIVYYCGKNMDGNYLNIAFALYPESGNNIIYYYDCFSNVPYIISIKSSDKTLEYKIKLYNKIIDKIKNKDLPINDGIVHLPDEYSSASSNKEVFISETDQGLHILFKTWVGKGVNMRGFLYTEKSIKLFNPKVFDKTYNIIGQSYNIIEKINKNWYYVSWSLK